MGETRQAPASLEARGVAMPLVEPLDVEGFVAAVNAKARIAGLDDAVNPGLLDAGKLRGFVGVLARQPAAFQGRVVGRLIGVGSAGLGVLAIEPTAEGAFGAGYRLEIEREAGNRVLLVGHPAIDGALAQARAAASEAATLAADHAVAAGGGDLGALRWRRYQAARGWLIVASAWARVDAKGSAASLERARAAAKKFSMPGGAQP